MFSNRPATAGSTECERSGCELVIKILPAFNLSAQYVTSMGTFIGFFSAARGFYCLCPDKSCPRQRCDKHLPRAADALGSDCEQWLWTCSVLCLKPDQCTARLLLLLLPGWSLIWQRQLWVFSSFYPTDNSSSKSTSAELSLPSLPCSSQCISSSCSHSSRSALAAICFACSAEEQAEQFWAQCSGFTDVQRMTNLKCFMDTS